MKPLLIGSMVELVTLLSGRRLKQRNRRSSTNLMYNKKLKASKIRGREKETMQVGKKEDLNRTSGKSNRNETKQDWKFLP
eukprot:12054853-Ditylum_brightwellii.AAC.1